MPGTIQVTVLEFKGVSSSSRPSAKSLKVSMGKRQYQTWDKGDFSFSPITKIREDLVVALLDAGGNEIAHQDIRTMQIIEKGCWDEVFTINGGGLVHLKLQFFLSEEDRNRIRIMRESAMKKKLETNPNIKLKLSEVTSSSDSAETSTQHEQKVSDSQKGFVEKDVVSLKVEASEAGSSLASATSSAAVSLPSHQNKQGGSIQESAFTNATDWSEGAPSSPAKHGVKPESLSVQERVPYETHKTRALANVRSDTEEGPSSRLLGSSVSDKNNTVAFKLQDPAVRTPSNVRKMISAFENSQLQEVKSPKKASSVPSQLNKLRKGGLLEEEPKAEKILRDFKDHFPGTMRQSPPERMAEEEATQPYNVLSSKMLNYSTESSAAEESGSGRGRGTGLESSTVIMASKRYKEECYSGQSSGMWIFPDNTRRLCSTTAGKQVMKRLGHHNYEAKASQVNKISSESKKKNVEQPESEPGCSPDNSSNGLVGQVIKIAVIIGFGVLVLLTRQKEPRKKEREENKNLFHAPEYVDTTLKPWTVKP